jgi:hypothetical protein
LPTISTGIFETFSLLPIPEPNSVTLVGAPIAPNKPTESQESGLLYRGQLEFMRTQSSVLEAFSFEL